MMPEGHERLEENLSVIRHYLRGKFPGCTISEYSILSRYQEFIVRNGAPLTDAPSDDLGRSPALLQNHKLKVDWSRLSQDKNTPERMLFLLHSTYVADWMVRTGQEQYSWNPAD
jgi:hypothetical protein